MPITLAHPAVVAPLAKWFGRYMPLSALVWGSFMPDLLNYGGRVCFGVLIDRSPASYNLALHFRYITHSLWPGTLYAVLLAWPLFLFYHLVLKRPLAALLPDKVLAYTLRQPLWGPLHPTKHWWEVPIGMVAVTVALAVGSMSHVVWDWCTHGGTPITRHFPWTSEPLLTISGYTLYPYNVSQHFFSAVGLSLLAWWSWRWLKAQPEPAASFQAALSTKERVGIIAALILASCMVGVVVGLESASGRLSLAWLEDFAGGAVVSTLLTWTGLLGVYAIISSLAAPQFRRETS